MDFSLHPTRGGRIVMLGSVDPQARVRGFLHASHQSFPYLSVEASRGLNLIDAPRLIPPKVCAAGL